MTSSNDNDAATAKKLADMFLADFDNLVANSRPSTAVPSSRTRAEKPSIDSYGVSDWSLETQAYKHGRRRFDVTYSYPVTRPLPSH